LSLAVVNSNVDMVKLLLEREDIDVSIKFGPNRRTALEYAFKEKNYDILKAFALHQHILNTEDALKDQRYQTIIKEAGMEIFKAIRPVIPGEFVGSRKDKYGGAAQILSNLYPSIYIPDILKLTLSESARMAENKRKSPPL